MFHRRPDPFDLPLVSHEVTVVLQKGCHLEGRLQFEGTARIDGSFKGEIFTPDILIIGDDAQVSGQIEADVVVISGHFSGDVYATQRVEIQAPAVVRGTVQTAILQIEEGAVFDGKTKMLGPLSGRPRQEAPN
ncbi:MAG: polymer-forming cytoskeletal protein [Deltaproteobacteria bacterium]|nr:polymer-forming cytoskeletal protein [Deltaproteobacteria bacterium]MBM4315967.1 polymer-forming cytoskeletal protein [Deltaproteobacteria bacterium]